MSFCVPFDASFSFILLLLLSPFELHISRVVFACLSGCVYTFDISFLPFYQSFLSFFVHAQPDVSDVHFHVLTGEIPLRLILRTSISAQLIHSSAQSISCFLFIEAALVPFLTLRFFKNSLFFKISNVAFFHR